MSSPPTNKVLPLFGSGMPLCWCGAAAEQAAPIFLGKHYPTLCGAHQPSDKQLQAESVARADAVLALHFDKAGQVK